jgi:hypothetical protein
MRKFVSVIAMMLGRDALTEGLSLPTSTPVVTFPENSTDPFVYGCQEVRGGFGRVMGAGGWSFDTGASEDIVNKEDDEEILTKHYTPGAAIIEAIGQDIGVDTTATIRLPGIQDPRGALAVSHSPNCASGGKVVQEDGHTFFWSPSSGAWTIFRDGGAMRLDVVNNVPHFPTPGRTGLNQSLCDAGFTEEVRRLEKMSDSELEACVTEFRGLRAEFAAAVQSVKEEDLPAFLDSKAGLDLREKILAGRKRLRRKSPCPPAEKDEVPAPDAALAPSSDAAPVSAATPRAAAAPATNEEKVGDVAPATTSTSTTTTNMKKKEAKKLRRKARDSKLRLEMSTKLAAEEGRPPTEHFLTHTPADPRCRFCILSKQRKAAARPREHVPPVNSAKDSPDVLGLVHLDLIRVWTPDHNGHRWWMTSRDQKSKYPRGVSLADKEPESTWAATQLLFPGSRLRVGEELRNITDKGGKVVEAFFRTASVDGGTEWLGVWKKNVEERGGIIRVSLPGESRTNADVERFNLETEVQTAASLLTAGAAPWMWSLAARVFYHNYARTVQDDADKTPYQHQWDGDFQGELYTFGCQMDFVRDPEDRDKFQSRSAPGCFMAYVPGGGAEVLDLEAYKPGKIRFVKTRNFQADRDSYPLRDYEHDDLEEFQFITNPEEDYTDENGILRCWKCEKVSRSQEVTCQPCLARTKHPRGRPSPDSNPGCLRGRCTGHSHEPEQSAMAGAPEAPSGTIDVAMEGGDDAAPEPGPAAPQPPAPPAAPPVIQEAQVVAPAVPSAEAIADAIAYRYEQPLFFDLPRMGIGKCRASSVTRGKALGARAALKRTAALEHELDRDHFQVISEVKRSLGLVTKVMNATSREVLENPVALAMVYDEFKQLEDTCAISSTDVVEWQDALARYPNARRVGMMMLTADKNIEDPVRRKFKSRGVALGNRLRDRYGSVVREHLLHAVPASVGMIRLGCGWALLTNSRGKRGDARGAYLQAALSGPPVFIKIEDKLFPPHWKKGTGFKGPVRRVWNSMYGLQRGSCDWGRRAHEVLVGEAGAHHIGDHGEGSLYAVYDKAGKLPPTLVILYADDFDVVGPEENRIYDVLGLLCSLTTTPARMPRTWLRSSGWRSGGTHLRPRDSNAL